MATRISPRQNKLLAALPAPDYEWLRPHLDWIALPRGATVHVPGDRESELYFVVEGLVSSAYVTSDGAAVEFALTGNEGVIGVASVLGGQRSPTRATVVSAGCAWRLPARAVRHDLDHDGPLAQVLLRYTLALIAQAGQGAACNRHHSLEQRLCRWMLAALDRLPTDRLDASQEWIGEMLGVRRERVSEAAANLQRQGLIRYSRGCIHVVDRGLMEALACECYAAVRQEYDRLLPPPQAIAGDGVFDRCRMARAALNPLSVSR